MAVTKKKNRESQEELTGRQLLAEAKRKEKKILAAMKLILSDLNYFTMARVYYVSEKIISENFNASDFLSMKVSDLIKKNWVRLKKVVGTKVSEDFLSGKPIVQTENMKLLEQMRLLAMEFNSGKHYSRKDIIEASEGKFKADYGLPVFSMSTFQGVLDELAIRIGFKLEEAKLISFEEK